MNEIQTTFLLLFAGVNVCIAIKSLFECMQRKNAYGETILLYPLGIYVYGDGVVFGTFWAAASVASLILSDWILFLLIVSVFWLVRSVGETIYWFNQQFSTITRMEPKRYITHKIFHNDSVWFVFQIMNQCLTVITIITTVYLFHLWLP